MFKFIFNKIINKKPEPQKAEEIAGDLKDSSRKLLSFLSKKVSESIQEIGIIKIKLKNLEETNFNLGRLHLEKGDLKEARFRFYLMTKFYPKNLDAKYELAYCYALMEKYLKSQKTLEHIVKQNPNYSEKAIKLLEHVKKLQKTQ